jgi:predicted dehydrogenase
VTAGEYQDCPACPKHNLSHDSQLLTRTVSNSTVESAQRSIDFHNLGPDVKAYGSSEDLSKDETVDMVVVSVRIGKHYELAKPALEAGKDVFVEWPLGATLTEAEELATLAKEKGVKTMVGLQSRASALVVKLRELLGSGNEGVQGEIGRVVNSSVVGSFGGIALGNRGRLWPEGAEYYLDMDSGGNSFMIYFGHCVLLLSCLPRRFDSKLISRSPRYIHTCPRTLRLRAKGDIGNHEDGVGQNQYREY